MNQRLERILKELESRYGMGPEFSDEIRPIASKIFSPDINEKDRQKLLTLLAETYERQACVRRNLKIAEEALKKFFNDLAALLRLAYRLRRREKDNDISSDPSPGKDPSD